MIDPEERKNKAESAVLIGLITDQQDATQVAEYLDELEFLATTADITTLKRFSQKLHKPEGRTYIGSGAFSNWGADFRKPGAQGTNPCSRWYHRSPL